ncbi:MAG: pyruvate kinase, partial [Pseudomonadota bacterium]
MHGKLTKIIATIGPASESAEQIEKLILAGVNVFRLNFSHGAKEKHQQVFQTIRQISERMNHPVGILQDLSGPKIRVGNIAGDNLQLDQGDTLVLTSDPSADGTGKRVSINYPKLAQEVKVGEIIYLSDGLIALKIKEIKGPSIYSEVLDGGVLKSKKGVNFPMTKLSISAITDKDRDDLNFGIKLGVDWVALSFVRTAQDIHELRELMKKEGRVAPIIAKIEKPEALENLDQIIAEADGVMVARGDLAVETPMEKVPTVQKQIIKKANFAGKVVV